MANSANAVYRLVLKADVSRSMTRRVRPWVADDGDNGFWSDLRKAPVRPLETSKSEAAGFEAHTWARAGERDVPDRSAARARLRLGFPKALRAKVVAELKSRYGSPDDTKKAQETQKAIEGVDFVIDRIESGSLVVYLIALGFAKLAATVNITPDEFSTYIQLAAPFAMSLLYGVDSGAIEAQASEASGADEESPVAKPGKPVGAVSLGPVYPLMGYVALLTLGAGFLVWNVSSRLADERAEYRGYLHDEMESVARERAAIADKLAALVAQRETSLTASQKTLFDNQLDLLKSASAAATARDGVLVDLAKTRMTPPAAPADKNAVKVELVSRTTPPCVLDPPQVRNLQAALSEQSLYVRALDGLWGPYTQDSVRRFQSRMNLPVTGQLDVATATKLGVACGGT